MKALFSLSTLRKHYELIPLVSLAATAMVGYVAYGIYIFHTRSDVWVIKSRDEPFKRIDMEKPQTLRLFQKKEYKNTYPKEMDDLRREIWKS